MFGRYIAPFVAVIGLASAQTATTASVTPTASVDCTVSGTTTLNSNAQATALGISCPTFAGSIAIASNVVGDIHLDGLQTITGSLNAVGAVNMTGLYASTLGSIGDSFNLQQLTILSTLSFPMLKTVVKAVNWQTLNQLQLLTFTSGLTSAASLTISDTQLNTLDGINLRTVGDMNINNNNYLKTIDTQIQNITGLLSLSANGPNLTVTFPNLGTVKNMTVANVTALTIPSLSRVSGAMGFYNNYFTSLRAPNLTSVGDLTFNANPYLTNISLPNLATITAGSLFIANNSVLTSIDGFGSLRSTGAISISGNYTSISLPSLADDKGALYLVSSGQFDCAPFLALSTQIVKGLKTCTAQSNNVQSGGSSGTSGNAGSGSASSTSKAAASNVKVDMSAIYGVFSLAAIFTLIGGAAGVAQLVL